MICKKQIRSLSVKMNHVENLDNLKKMENYLRELEMENKGLEDEARTMKRQNDLQKKQLEQS